MSKLASWKSVEWRIREGSLEGIVIYIGGRWVARLYRWEDSDRSLHSIASFCGVDSAKEWIDEWIDRITEEQSEHKNQQVQELRNADHLDADEERAQHAG